MKLAAIALLSTLGLGLRTASADPAPAAPSGAPVAPYAAGPARAGRGQLRQILLERFDANHDGRLEPQERRRAVRALRRIARRMAREDRRTGQRELRARGLARRFDRNGDGVVTPDEMPPGLARRLQRLDQNRDGWLDDRDR